MTDINLSLSAFKSDKNFTYHKKEIAVKDTSKITKLYKKQGYQVFSVCEPTRIGKCTLHLRKAKNIQEPIVSDIPPAFPKINISDKNKWINRIKNTLNSLEEGLGLPQQREPRWKYWNLGYSQYVKDILDLEKSGGAYWKFKDRDLANAVFAELIGPKHEMVNFRYKKPTLEHGVIYLAAFYKD